MERIIRITGIVCGVALLLLLAACAAEGPTPTSPSQRYTPPPTRPAPQPTTIPAQEYYATGAPTGTPAPMAGAMARMAEPAQSGQTLAAEGFNTIGGSATVNDAPYDLTFFKHYGVNPFIDTEDDHLSTFAIDVDTASYTVARRFVQDGNLPEPDSVRVEEFVNFFDQGYERPEEGAFAIHVEGSPSPFGGDNHWLMRVGLQGKSVSSEDRKDATLVFTIDVSGSMGREDRLGLVKKSLRLLVDELRATDKVGIVIYGSHGSVLLEPTSGEDKARIMRAIDSLNPGRVYLRRGRAAFGVPDGLRRRGTRTDNPRHSPLRRRWQRREYRGGLNSTGGQEPRGAGRNPYHGRLRDGQLQRHPDGASG